MLSKLLSGVLLLFVTVLTTAQSNFTYTPENPKAGEVITITYEPAGVLAGNLKPVEAVYYTSGGKNTNADDIVLKRTSKKFTGTVRTDTANSLVYFGFSIDNQQDNNFNQGYYILLRDNEGRIKTGAYEQLAFFYQMNQVGVDRDYEKALSAIEKEMESNPTERHRHLVTYIRFLHQAKRPDAAAIAQKELEARLKNGLDKEEDYQVLEGLYTVANLPEQAKLIGRIKKEKFPDGKWKIGEFIEVFFQEKDAARAEQMKEELLRNIETNPDWSYLLEGAGYYSVRPLWVYYRNKDWEGLKRVLPAYNGADSEEMAGLLNDLAWELQKTGTDLAFAEEAARKATLFAKNNITRPAGKKPVYLTTKQWERNRKFIYAQYADTYAMVWYKMGQYKKAWDLTREAVAIGERKNLEHLKTYTLVAEKILPEGQYRKEMEEFVRGGKATTEMSEGLKKIYIKEKGSDAGFSDYIAALKKEAYEKMVAELRKSMINEAAPAFTLSDLEGKKIQLSDLKGKTVVVDFWATWCGPCISSFPGMQKMVDKYKDNPDVKFVFIDTWESGEDKRKIATDFIANNKYRFHVLVDEENKAVADYKVEGIPTKFVIDKNGNIRFKSVGFNGSDDKLSNELTAMIEMASEERK